MAWLATCVTWNRRAASRIALAKRPLVVKAKKAQGTNGSDVVVDDEQGKILHALSENLTFLRECRVLFVLE